MRQWPAVPELSAERSSREPALAFEQPAAAAIQSEGRFAVASTVPLSAAAHFTGGAPILILRIADVPMTVSIASS